MAHVTADRVRDTSTTTGSGNFTVSGTAPTGFRTLSAVLTANDTFYYAIQHQTSNEWEVGLGTYSSTANEFARTTVYASSSSGSAVNFAAGTKDVFITLAAARTVQLDNNGAIPGITDAGNLTFTGTGRRITGDFSNATVANRVNFQTSTTNGATYVSTLPLGTGTASGFFSYNAADGDNASFIGTYLTSTLSVINSGKNGTGSYLPMTFYTGGSERMRIDTSGNVGIGTSSPAFKFVSVGGGIQLSGGTTSQEGVRIQRASGVCSFTGINNDNNAYNALSFATSASEAMRIDTSGNVGIGTSSPGVKLDVQQSISGGAGLAGRVYNPDTGATSAAYITAYQGTVQTAIYSYGNSGSYLGSISNNFAALITNNTERMRIDTSGNVGIGTSSPGNKLDIVSAGSSQIRVKDGVNSTAYYDFGRDGTDGFFGFSGAQTTFSGYKWSVNAGTEVMRITNSGNVGIGTSSPAKSLTVQASEPMIQLVDADLTTRVANIGGQNGNVTIDIDPAATAAASFFSVNIDNSERARIDSSGNLLVGQSSYSATTVGVGINPAGLINIAQNNSTSGGTGIQIYSTAASAYRFYVTMDGKINCTSTTIAAISDARLKENVRDLDAGLDAIMALKPRKFDWKEGKGKDIKNDRGFIAQEFEQVFPDLIDEWKDPAPEGEEPYKSVRADLIPVLVKAIQELKAELDALKGAK